MARRAVDWRRPHLLIARRPCCACLGSLVLVFAILAIFGVGIVQGTFEIGISFDEDQMSIRGDEVADRELAVDAGLTSSSSLSPTQLLLLRHGRRQRALSSLSAAAPSRWSFNKIGDMYLHLRRAHPLPASGAASLFDDDALRRFALLQDELLRDPDLQAICDRRVTTGASNASFPSHGHCSGWQGVSYALRLPVARRSRYASVRLALPPGVPRAVVVAALSAATVSGGGINASGLADALALVTNVTVDGGGLHGSGGGGSEAEALCTNGTIEGDPGVSSAADAVVLAGCGPPLDCCGCRGGSDGARCAALPLCVAEGDALVYHDASRTPPPAAAVDAPTFLASHRAVRAALSREVSGCDGGSPLRDRVGWSTSIDFRNGSESELLRLRARLPVGGWRRDGESYRDYRQRGRERALASFRRAHRTVLRETRGFSEAHADLDASFWAFDATSLSLSTALGDALLNAAAWAGAGIGAGWLYMVLHLRSLLLATAGLFGVFLSFPLACFVYTGVFDLGLLGVFNTMGLLCAPAPLATPDRLSARPTPPSSVRATRRRPRVRATRRRPRVRATRRYPRASRTPPGVFRPLPARHEAAPSRRAPPTHPPRLPTHPPRLPAHPPCVARSIILAIGVDDIFVVRGGGGLELPTRALQRLSPPQNPLFAPVRHMNALSRNIPSSSPGDRGPAQICPARCVDVEMVWAR